MSDDEYKFPVGKETVSKAIEELVEAEGIEKITSSYIRNHLKEKFNADFTDFKKMVDILTKKVIEGYMARRDKAKKEEEEEDESSDQLNTSASASESSPVKKEPVKPEKKEKEDSSDSDSDSDHGIASTDRVRAAPKGRKRTTISPSADVLDEPPKKRAAAKKAEFVLTKSTRIKKRNEKKKAARGSSDNSGRFGRMTSLCLLSDDLQNVLNNGKKFMKRCDVMKAMWAYIREHDLLDPKDKRFALTDEKLKPLFQKKARFRAFSMMKDLSKHIWDPKDLDEEVQQEALAEQNRLRTLMEEKEKEEIAKIRARIDGDDDGAEENGKGKDEEGDGDVPESDGSDSD